MREKFYKIKKFNKGILLNLHRNMLTVKDDAMLIVIHIWGILKSPGAVIYSDRNESVILSGRMINSSCISFVLRAKKTFRITAGFYKLGSSDCLRIFFRFGKIDGDIDFTIFTVYCPFLIFLYTITTNIIAVLTEFIEVIGCFLWIFLISAPELILYLRRTRHQTVHKSGIKKVSVHNTVFYEISLHSLIQKCI